MSTSIQPGCLVDEINAEHSACLAAANDALEHAMRCGDLLTEAKAKCKHGDWQSWLTKNFDGSVRTARVYMRLANNRERLAKAQSPALLTIYEATSLISKSTLGLPPELEAELAQIASTVRGLLEEWNDSKREELKLWQEWQEELGSKFYDVVMTAVGMTKAEVQEHLRWLSVPEGGLGGRR